MKVDVTKERVAITQCHVVTEGEYCVNECEFQLPECFNGLTVTAVFNNIPVPLLNNKCYIPSLKKGGAVLGVYAYRKNGEALELVYSPKPTAFYVDEGSYSKEIAVEEYPEISRYEEYCTMLSQLCENLISQIDFIGKSSLSETISIDSTHSQVPTARAVYDNGQGIVKEFKNDISLLEEKQKELIGSVSNTLKGKKEGGKFLLTDISPLSHEVRCMLKGLNLSSVSTTGDFVQRKQITFDKTYPVGTYSFSAVVKSSDVDSSMCLFSFTLKGTSKKAVTIARSVGLERVCLENISVPSEFDGICFYASTSNANASGDSANISGIQLEAGSVATEYVPYFNYRNSSVIIGGKNLCPIGNIECKPDESGASVETVTLANALPKGIYSLGAVVESNDTNSSECMVAFEYSDSQTEPRIVGYCMMGRSKNGERVSVDGICINEPFNRICFYPSASDADSFGDAANFIGFQLEFGEFATGFESYKPTQKSISESENFVHLLQSYYPVTSVYTLDVGAKVEVDYNRDINKVIAELEKVIAV